MNYSGINAKIHGMLGKLLTDEDFKNLCSMKSVADFGLYFKNNPIYKHTLESISEHDIHREPIEQRIVISLHEDFARIYKFVGDYNLRHFLDRFFLKHEIHTIKVMLCMVYDERDITYMLPELNELLDQHLAVDMVKLKNAKTVPDFIGALQGTEFYHVLANVYNENTTLFQLEMQLDLYYFLQVWRSKEIDLDKANRALLDRLIGTETDLQNIVWIYRLKNFYNMPPNLIYSLLIPNNYRLKRGQINRMVDAKTMDELKTEILSTVYGKAFGQFDKLEAVFYREVNKLYNSLARKYPHSLAVTLSYLFRKELEIKNLISVLEGIRYSLPPNEIYQYVTLQKGEEAS